MSGKTLRYDSCDMNDKKKLDESRAVEWKKWQHFGASVKIEGDTLQELLQEGHHPIPTQWIDTDKNEHLKRPGAAHESEMKSRLVACGQFENRQGIRSDSPTADVEGLNIVCSFAACNHLRIRCSDLRNAYFNGVPLDRLLLLWPPKGGLPGEGNDRYALASNLPVYGTGDAGRRFYKAFRSRAIQVGFVEVKVMRSLYSYSIDGKIMVILAAHVDDLLYACVDRFQYLIDELLAQFEVKETKEGNFRFCGREYEQSDDFSIRVTCRDNTEKTLPINYTLGDRSMSSKATPGEVSQLRSVVGSLAWISRQCRPDKTYICSKLQSIANVAEVKHLEVANRTLREMCATSATGLFFKAGAFNFDEAILITITDASWANDVKIVDAKEFPRRSQFGRIHLLADPCLWNGNAGQVHFIGWKSGLIKRTCRSTLRAETHAMIYGTEASDNLRAVLVSLRGKLGNKKDWENMLRSR